MKTLGLIGGSSYHSTIDYYRQINEKVNRELGHKNSAKIILYSFNFQEELDLIQKKGWNHFLDRAEHYSRQLHSSGSDCILLCANSMHIIVDSLEKRIKLPIINMVKETARILSEEGIRKAALLGTRFTMQAGFYNEELSRHKIECLLPPEEDIHKVHRIIFSELTENIIRKPSKDYLMKLIENFEEQGAEAIILGCTELPLIIKEDDTVLKLIDTLEIHTDAAVEFALK